MILPSIMTINVWVLIMVFFPQNMHVLVNGTLEVNGIYTSKFQSG